MLTLERGKESHLSVRISASLRRSRHVQIAAVITYACICRVADRQSCRGKEGMAKTAARGLLH